MGTGDFTRVYVTKDYDGHDYVIPYELKEEFGLLLELSTDDTDAEDEFIEKFSDYMTGGCVNELGLYKRNT